VRAFDDYVHKWNGLEAITFNDDTGELNELWFIGIRILAK
jgi:hypothetical protein